MARGISMASPVPVLVMPHVVQPVVPAADRRRFGLDTGEFLFLFSFDFHSTFSRKNPMGVVEAFQKSIRSLPASQARAEIAERSNDCPDRMASLMSSAEGLRVTFIDRQLDPGERSVLMASCDSFVSLHRAEGFGLGMAEAMAMGKPVIATGWSGNTDFMNVDNSLPVRFSLEPLEETDPPYEKGSIWAVPDLDDAAVKMRLVYSDRELAASIGMRASRYMARFHSASAIGALIDSRLRLIGEGEGFRHAGHRKALPSDSAMSVRSSWQLSSARVVVPCCASCRGVSKGSGIPSGEPVNEPRAFFNVPDGASPSSAAIFEGPGPVHGFRKVL